MNETDTAVLDPRQAVVNATRHTSGTLLYTAPVIDAATALLADVWAAAEQHGVAPGGLNVAYQCLEAAERAHRVGRPETVEQAQLLVEMLVEEFALLGVTASLDVKQGTALLPRAPGTPSWGYREPIRMGATACIGRLDGGWDLVLEQRGTKMVGVAATCDRAGAAAVARLAVEVNAGRHGNPFRW